MKVNIYCCFFGNSDDYHDYDTPKKVKDNEKKNKNDLTIKDRKDKIDSELTTKDLVDYSNYINKTSLN